MSQKGQEDILDGEWGGDVLGEDVVVAEARGACADVGGEGFGVRMVVQLYWRAEAR